MRDEVKVLALDPATKCGFAHTSGGSGTWDLSCRRDESGGMRLVRLVSKLDWIAAAVGVDLVVFEAARHGAPRMAGALVVQAELQGIIKHWCEQKGINYRGYSPTELKRHATGKGNAGKPAMLEAARAKWPGTNIEDDNQADSLWLLDLAMTELNGAIR
jgi:Holliday junction resolvasome RuvABC endonuclease subunit